MNALNKLLLASSAIVATLASGAATAATTNIPSSVTVVTPISLSEPADLRFGSIATSSSAGTVVIAPPATLPSTLPTTAAPYASGTRSSTGGVTLIGGGTCSGTVPCGPGSLQLAGGADLAFNIITLPGSAVALTGSGLTAGMEVFTFTSRYGEKGTAGVTSGAGTLDSSGDALFMLGGTLTVPANALAGTYTGNVSVTINY